MPHESHSHESQELEVAHPNPATCDVQDDETHVTARRDIAYIEVGIADDPPRLELQAWVWLGDGTAAPVPEIWVIASDSVSRLAAELLEARDGALAQSTLDPDRGDDLDEDQALSELLVGLSFEEND